MIWSIKKQHYTFLHLYFSRQFSDAAEEDLFDALQEAIQEDNRQLPDTFTNIMSSWTRQSGYPVVVLERNYSSSTVKISQRRYLSNTSITQDPTTWWIPYNFATASSPNFDETIASHWLPKDTQPQDVLVEGLNETDWLIINKQVCKMLCYSQNILSYRFIF